MQQRDNSNLHPPREKETCSTQKGSTLRRLIDFIGRDILENRTRLTNP